MWIPWTGSYNVYSDQQWQEQQNEQMGLISLVLGGIAAISLLVGGIGIMNIMLVTVTERTRGDRASAGPSAPSAAASLPSSSSRRPCSAGWAASSGSSSARGGSLLLGQGPLQNDHLPAAWITACAFGFSVLLGVIFGLYPAVKAANLQPVEALRAE